MNIKEYKLKFITPALLVGADLGKSEIRSSTIRGELRWWFRVLGGTIEEERHVFGGISNEMYNQNISSSIVVRVSNIKKYDRSFPPKTLGGRNQRVSGFDYLAHFARESGKEKNTPYGPRINNAAFYYPGSSFQLSICIRREISQNENVKLEKAIDAFIKFGTIGLRSTRGFGAFVEDDTSKYLKKDEFLESCKENYPDLDFYLPNVGKEIFMDRQSEDKGAYMCLDAMGTWLSKFREDTKLKGNEKTSLGYSFKEEGTDTQFRESSALHLRPVRVQEGYLPLMFYTDKACSQESIKDKFSKYANLL